MKKFYLFPPDEGLTPLIWLCFLLIPLFSMYPYQTLEQQVFTGIVFLFGLCYRNCLFEGKYFQFWIAMQYLIGFIYIVYWGYVFLFMFPAWKIGFSRTTKKQFLTLYAIMVLAIIAGILIAGPEKIFLSREQMITSSAFTIFTLSGPFSGREFLKQQAQRRQMYQANQRLEKVIVGEERNRIARELHDSLGQSLSVMTIKLDLASQLIDHDTKVAKEEVQQVHQLSRETLAAVREIVTDMRRKTIEEELIEMNRALSAAKIILTTEGESILQAVPKELQNELSYCLREAITNVIRHSQATYCNVKFHLEKQSCQFTIEDNGIGLKNKNFGNGLKGMRERVEQLGGHLLVTDQQGTAITISVPTKPIAVENS